MHWRRDYTHRFAQFPYYEAAELDYEAQELVNSFLEKRYSREPTYPIATDDLFLLIESLADDLDWRADLSVLGVGVEGLTEFRPGRKPLVSIAQHLAAPNMRNRFRMTVAHELAHVRLHDCLYQLNAGQLGLFGAAASIDLTCRTDVIDGALKSDWMEWQAGYVGGAILMPIKPLRALFPAVDTLADPDSPRAAAMCREVTGAFDVSEAAARVRLSQVGLLGRAPQLQLKVRG